MKKIVLAINALVGRLTNKGVGGLWLLVVVFSAVRTMLDGGCGFTPA